MSSDANKGAVTTAKGEIKHGVHIVGRIITKPEFRSGISKAGKPYFSCGYSLLCGETLVKYDQFDQEPFTPFVIGDVLSIEVRPGRGDQLFTVGGDAHKVG